MTAGADDPRELAKKLLAALEPPAAANDEERQVDDATIEAWAEQAAERMRRARKR